MGFHPSSYNQPAWRKNKNKFHNRSKKNKILNFEKKSTIKNRKSHKFFSTPSKPQKQKMKLDDIKLQSQLARPAFNRGRHARQRALADVEPVPLQLLGHRHDVFCEAAGCCPTDYRRESVYRLLHFGETDVLFFLIFANKCDFRRQI